MLEILTMSMKERQRLQVISRIKHGDSTVSEAAESLGITERQMYRILCCHRSQGDVGLVHRLRGRPSNRGYAPTVRQTVERLYRERYSDYGPTLFSEMLLEHHELEIDSDTLRRWLKASGLWTGSRAARRHRRKRERREALGALLQFDGSFHDWFESRGPACCLLVAIDDASGRLLMRFAKSENTAEVLQTLWDYVQRYGIPQAFYSDHGSVYYNKNHHPTDVARALSALGVRLILAHSPQAKGRVERSNRTHQDRLIKALRRENISCIDEANRFLERHYLREHNRRFAQLDHLSDIHRPSGGIDLKNIFCFETSRTIHNDYTITLDAQFIQLERSKTAPLPAPNTTVVVRRWLNGSLHIFSHGQELSFTPLATRPPPKNGTHPPPHDSHPWRRGTIGKGRSHVSQRKIILASKQKQILLPP
jgi:hypothetical protein